MIEEGQKKTPKYRRDFPASCREDSTAECCECGACKERKRGVRRLHLDSRSVGELRLLDDSGQPL